MNRQSLLFFILILSVTVATLHMVALTLYLYWFLPWFDILMHFLGGVLVALVGIWIVFYSRYVPSFPMNGRHLLYVALAAAIIVGVGWEVFEFIAGLRPRDNYITDTAIDLVMDLLGAVSVYWVIVHSRLYSVLQ